MNLLKEYKNLKYDERIELIKLIEKDLNFLKQLKVFMTPPKIEVKEKSDKAD